MAKGGAGAVGDFNVGAAFDAIAGAYPDDEALVFRAHRLTWSDVADRTNRLANHLHGLGLGCRHERGELAAWQSGQDHLAIYLYNGNEYLEAMLGAFKARLAPFNVNYRYVADELRYLLRDASTRAVIYHSVFAPVLADVVADVATIVALIQVADDSGNALLPGAHWYEDALAAASSDPPPVARSPDDLYILYTGGTTGMPKGVLWRQGDAWVECFGGNRLAATLDDVVASATNRVPALLAPPFMHGAGHWMSFLTWNGGGTVFIQDHPEHFVASDIWGVVERERITRLLIVGDAFARPLVDELDRRSYDLACLTVLVSGGAPLSAGLKNELLSHLPSLMIVDGLGSSEAGGQVSHVSTGSDATTGTFTLAPGNVVLSSALDRVLEPGDSEVGWLAKRGRLALGYLGDRTKTERTYPTIDAIRYAVPGDRARLLSGGIVELQGRDSVTIVSGGEKIFVEEVEAALKCHAGVYDCVVAGRPSERWGSEVVAIVRLRSGHDVDTASLLAVAERRIARYKLPKEIVYVDEIVRSPSGKADYRWARSVAEGVVAGRPLTEGTATDPGGRK